MPESVRIGLGQVSVTMGDKLANQEAMIEALKEAARHNYDLIVLPECGLAGWLDDSAASAAESIPGPFCETLQQFAAKHHLAIVAGLEERDGNDVCNAAIFIDETGGLLSRHRKINELQIGRSLYRIGSKLEVFCWRGYRVGLLICADCWPSEFVDSLHAMGANLILSPCAWAVASGGEETNIAWIQETYRQRIGIRDLTIVAANGVGPVTSGPWKGRVLQGNSLAIGSWGQVLAPAHTPGVTVFELPSIQD